MAKQEDCSHIWIIGTITQQGVCKLCGATRDFNELLKRERQSNWKYQRILSYQARVEAAAALPHSGR